MGVGRCYVGPRYVVHYLVSRLAILSLKKKEIWLFYFNCLLMLFDNKCSVSLPHGAVGGSIVCSCGVS